MCSRLLGDCDYISMFCSGCGSRLEVTNKFCPSCGHKTVEKREASCQKNSKKRYKMS